MSGLLLGLLGAAIGIAGAAFGTILGTRSMIAQAETIDEAASIKRKTAITVGLTILWLMPTLVFSLNDFGIQRWLIELGIWGSFVVLLAFELGWLWRAQILKQARRKAY